MNSSRVRVFSGSVLELITNEANNEALSGGKVQIVSASLFIEKPDENDIRRRHTTYYLTVVYSIEGF
jgi:hypothetical protein